MKKQNQLRKISINIFDMQTDFKPCVKRTQYSKRSSLLFTKNQQQKNWRSSSKKPDFIPVSRQQSIFKPKNIDKKEHNSISLAWEENYPEKVPKSRYTTISVKNIGDLGEEKVKLFQGKKRNSHVNNYSSIHF